MIKKLFLIFYFLLFSIFVSGNNDLSMQLFIKEDDGNVLEGVQFVEVNIYDSFSGGNSIVYYNETIIFVDGYVNINISDLNLNYSQSEFYIGVEINGDGELNPRTVWRTNPFDFTSDHFNDLQDNNILQFNNSNGLFESRQDLIINNITANNIVADSININNITGNLNCSDILNSNVNLCNVTDNNTQLNQSQIEAFGFVTGSHTIDTNTQLNESQVDAFVSNNGYLTNNESQIINGNLTVNGDVNIIGNLLNITVTNQYLNGSFLPSATSIFDIGSVSYLWNNIYANNLFGSLDCSNITGATSNLCTLVDTDTTLNQSDIESFGFVTGNHTIDTDTQLNESQVDAFVSNNGYLVISNLTGYDSNVSDDFDGEYSSLNGSPTNLSEFNDDLVHTVDTTLNESQVDAFADNNNYVDLDTYPNADTDSTDDITTSNIGNQNVNSSVYFVGNITESQISDLVHTIDTDNFWTISNNYLYNNSGILSLNQTLLNETIDDRTGIFEENVSIIVSGGSGTNVSVNCCVGSVEILSVFVIPTTNTTTYSFSANTTSGEVIDTNRMSHTGDWKIRHRGSSVIDENIDFYVSSSSVDENFDITLRYRR